MSDTVANEARELTMHFSVTFKKIHKARNEDNIFKPKKINSVCPSATSNVLHITEGTNLMSVLQYLALFPSIP